MRTYKLEFRTVADTEIFIVDAVNLDAAIREARKSGVTARVLWVTGQVVK